MQNAHIAIILSFNLGFEPRACMAALSWPAFLVHLQIMMCSGIVFQFPHFEICATGVEE